MYLPTRLADPAPLVVVMHGCQQSARGYLDHSGWAKYADQGGFALSFLSSRTGLDLSPSFLMGGTIRAMLQLCRTPQLATRQW